MNIAVIIVTYKTPKQDLSRLKKQFKEDFPSCSLTIIDNTGKKRGYAAGINKGLKKITSNPDIYIFANPDIVLDGIDQQRVFKGLEHFDVLGFAMKQSKKLYYGGTLDSWYLSGGLNTQKPLERYVEVDFVSGSLMAIKKEVIKAIDGFDERYFMYYEDVDYCLRARKKGFKVGIDSTITYIHQEVSSKNPKKRDLLNRAYTVFFSKYANPLQKVRLYVRTFLKHEY